jgi:hypothetical protein
MKRKYQVIIGLLLSMTAFFMLSCGDVMTGNPEQGETNTITSEPVVTYENGFVTITIPSTEIPNEIRARVAFYVIDTQITLSRIDVNTCQVSAVTTYPLAVWSCNYWLRMWRGGIVD